MVSESQVRIPLEIARSESHGHLERKTWIVTPSENIWRLHTVHTSQQASPLMLTNTHHYPL